MFRHPLRFMQFIEEWRRFETRIEDADDIRASGFNQMNREQRRKMRLFARKLDKKLGRYSDDDE